MKRGEPILAAPDPERISRVREMFGDIEGRYDFLNRLLSLRRDVAWRRFAVRRMRFLQTWRFLDVATGTADLAVEAVRHHREIQATGLDFVPGMIEGARHKVGGAGRIRLLQGDALALPFADGSFDVAAVAFGIRNMPDRLGALREMARVVVPGGQVMVLEMHLPEIPVVRPCYRFYLCRILPRLAGALSGNPEAYQYLSESIVAFPPPRVFSGIMRSAGLEAVECHSLTLGVTCLHIGRKPRR
ncbi:MAG: class I SAM-dependent methyltransferase [Syntrophaceae bacterium]|nr:class I SAM-dependent methyltransferase [Syntrophaceae bacterium]